MSEIEIKLPTAYEENSLINQRKNKLEEIKKLNINPYPYTYPKKHGSAEILKEYKGIKKEETSKTQVFLAGRITTLRPMGKASFGNLQDQTGQIQFYVREDAVGKEKYLLFKKIDIGDIIGVKGRVFRTKLGEITIWVRDLELLCKTLRSLPEKWHGLKDIELRYRQRYLDLIANPEVKEIFITRSKIISAIREFLNSKGFIEVEVPLLQPIYGGANAKPFKTHINAWEMEMYLSISPELYLKRLVVGGLERVYAITKSFRNEGVDKIHNPEFTTMECYQAYGDYNDMMRLTEDLYNYVAKKVLGKTTIVYQGKKIELRKPWKRISMADAIKRYLKINVNKLNDEEIKTILKNYNIEYKGDYNKGLAIAEIFDNLVESKLIQPTFLTDYPKETTPLCKMKRGNSLLVERFEPFINGWEVGNSYSELNDPILQKKLLEEQVKRGRGGYEEYHPMDQDFIRAIEYGMPPAGGLGLSIDRMTMLLTNASSIREVILFPTMKPEKR